MIRIHDVTDVTAGRVLCVTSASQIATKLRAGLAGPALLAVAGSDGVRCVARAGWVLAHDALPRYALFIPLCLSSVLIRALYPLHLCLAIVYCGRSARRA